MLQPSILDIEAEPYEALAHLVLQDEDKGGFVFLVVTVEGDGRQANLPVSSVVVLAREQGQHSFNLGALEQGSQLAGHLLPFAVANNCDSHSLVIRSSLDVDERHVVCRYLVDRHAIELLRELLKPRVAVLHIPVGELEVRQPAQEHRAFDGTADALLNLLAARALGELRTVGVSGVPLGLVEVVEDDQAVAIHLALVGAGRDGESLDRCFVDDDVGGAGVANSSLLSNELGADRSQRFLVTRLHAGLRLKLRLVVVGCRLHGVQLSDGSRDLVAVHRQDVVLVGELWEVLDAERTAGECQCKGDQHGQPSQLTGDDAHERITSFLWLG